MLQDASPAFLDEPVELHARAHGERQDLSARGTTSILAKRCFGNRAPAQRYNKQHCQAGLTASQLCAEQPWTPT